MYVRQLLDDVALRPEPKPKRDDAHVHKAQTQNTNSRNRCDRKQRCEGGAGRQEAEGLSGWLSTTVPRENRTKLRVFQRHSCPCL